MFTATLDRHAARRLTIAMTGVAGLGLLGAGALGVGGEGRLPAPPETNVGPGPDLTPEEEADNAPEIQNPRNFALNVADSFAVAYDWSAEPEQTETPARTEGTPPEDAVASAGQVRYLGSIIGPDRRLAIISIDGKQRIIAEGGQGEGVSLVRVQEDEITISDRDGTRRVSKAPPGSDLATVLATSAVAKPAEPVPPESDDDMMNLNRTREEMLERARERRGAQQRGAAASDARLDALQRNAATVQDGVVVTPGAGGTAGTRARTTRGTDSGSDRD